MSGEDIRCVVLADRHHGLTEGVRGLLETVFDAVVMVADEISLLESAGRLRPALAVVDLSLARGANLQWLERLRARCPGLKILVLSVHDEGSVAQTALAAGADGFILKRDIARDLLPAIDAVLNETRKVAPNLAEATPGAPEPTVETKPQSRQRFSGHDDQAKNVNRRTSNKK